jgi:hyaluronan synthase
VRLRRRLWLLWAVLIVGCVVGAYRHAEFFFIYRREPTLMGIWTVLFLFAAVQGILAWFERPFTVKRWERARLDRLRVTVNIPVYNEDAALLDRAIYALARQTRLPDCVSVVDDGSKQDYAEIRDWWQARWPARSEFRWARQANGGKKRAQAATFANDPHADIFVTIDSDTALAINAIEEGLKAFADPRVQSVAGLELPMNLRRNWITWLNGTRSVIWQLVSCSAQSVLGDVLVNRGTFALYRAEVVRDNLVAYVEEQFFGHRVYLGDDAALTLFARGRGRAVQQPSAVQFTMYPESLSHHLRQWVRWMRGLTVRTFWRIRYLPVWSYGWWFTVLSLWGFFASTASLLSVAVLWPESRAYLVTALGASVGWAWLMALRVFCVARSDERWWVRLQMFLLAPVAGWWVTFVLRWLRIYGIFTCTNDDWNTRQKVEVGIEGIPEFEPAEVA